MRASRRLEGKTSVRCSVRSRSTVGTASWTNGSIGWMSAKRVTTREAHTDTRERDQMEREIRAARQP